MLIWLIIACAQPPDQQQPYPDYPLDDALRLNHLQALGTHNSYHVAPESGGHPDWQYSHLPLAGQLSEQGVRQLELDLNYDPDTDTLLVQHIPLLDPGTTCETWVLCLEELHTWSGENPGHHPIFIVVEPKQPWDEDLGPLILERAEQELLSVWGEEGLYTPDELRGDAADLPAALAETGWPTLGEVRDRLVLSLLDTGDYRQAYAPDGDLAGRLMFADGEPGEPGAAFVSLDNPSDAVVREAVEAGYLVRTRADTDLVLDEARLALALESGAQFIATDVPDQISLEGGQPSRCNPVTAPADCSGADIEVLP